MRSLEGRDHDAGHEWHHAPSASCFAGAPLVGGVIAGAIPYSREELGFLQVLCSNVDDPDSMSGVSSLRARLLVGESGAPIIVDASPTTRMRSLRERILDLEHEGRWEDALLCYEQAIQAAEDSASEKTNGGMVATAAGAANPLDNAGRAMDDGDASHPVNGGNGVTEASVRQLHAGLLHCLCNVGHLETAREMRGATACCVPGFFSESAHAQSCTRSLLQSIERSESHGASPTLRRLSFRLLLRQLGVCASGTHSTPF